MNRRRSDLLQIDLGTWPAVDHHALPVEKRKAFTARSKAVELYICGTTLREIATQTVIQSRQLYWLLDRCLKQAEDGQIFGFRALLKGRHVEPYTRKKDFSADNVGTTAGFAGAFAMLLER